MDSRALLRRAFPYLVIGIGGFALAYVIIFVFVLPSKIVPPARQPYSPDSANILKPIDTLPRRAVVLNSGEEVEARVDLIASLYRDRRDWLRIRGLPVNTPGLHALVVKLEFDRLPDVVADMPATR